VGQEEAIQRVQNALDALEVELSGDATELLAGTRAALDRLAVMEKVEKVEKRHGDMFWDGREPAMCTSNLVDIKHSIVGSRCIGTFDPNDNHKSNNTLNSQVVANFVDLMRLAGPDGAIVALDKEAKEYYQRTNLWNKFGKFIADQLVKK